MQSHVSCRQHLGMLRTTLQHTVCTQAAHHLSAIHKPHQAEVASRASATVVMLQPACRNRCQTSVSLSASAGAQASCTKVTQKPAFRASVTVYLTHVSRATPAMYRCPTPCCFNQSAKPVSCLLAKLQNAEKHSSSLSVPFCMTLWYLYESKPLGNSAPRVLWTQCWSNS